MYNILDIKTLVPPPVGRQTYSDTTLCATVRHASCPAVAHVFLASPHPSQARLLCADKPAVVATDANAPRRPKERGLQSSRWCHPERSEGSRIIATNYTD